MQSKELDIHGSFFIKPKIFEDNRGLFFESWQQKRYEELGIDRFVQDNLSYSNKNVLRGMHYQIKHPIGQLVCVVEGTILDVLIDLRKNSKTFKKVISKELQKGEQLYMPPGIAHGFCVLSDIAILHYKCTEFYFPNDEGGVHWDSIGVNWPIKSPIVAKKDANFLKLTELEEKHFVNF